MILTLNIQNLLFSNLILQISQDNPQLLRHSPYTLRVMLQRMCQGIHYAFRPLFIMPAPPHKCPLQFPYRSLCGRHHLLHSNLPDVDDVGDVESQAVEHNFENVKAVEVNTFP